MPILADRRAPRRIRRPSRRNPEGRALFGARGVDVLDRGMGHALRTSPADHPKRTAAQTRSNGQTGSEITDPPLVVVHARPEIGDHLAGPALSGTVELEHLRLPFQVGLPVVRRDPRVGHGSALDGPRNLELFGTELGEVVLSMAADAVSDQAARCFPAPERRDRHTRHLGSLSDPHQPAHDEEVRTHPGRLQATCISDLHKPSVRGRRRAIHRSGGSIARPRFSLLRHDGTTALEEVFARRTRRTSR